MKTITEQDKIDWTKFHIVNREKVGGVIHETLENGKTYILESVTQTQYKLVGLL